MRKPTKDYLYVDEIGDQDDAVPFLGDLYSFTDEEFFPIEKKKLFVKSLSVTDDKFVGEVILADMDWSETPKKFDKVVVSVEVSIPRPGKEPLLGSWSLVDTCGKFRDEVNKDVSPGNIRVTYYYFQSLKRLTGLQAASRYKNLRNKCSFEQSLEDFTDSVKLIRGTSVDLMPQLDREKLQNILEDTKQLSVELNLLVQNWIRKLSSHNWIRFTYFLVRQFDLVDDFMKSPDNDIAMIQKTYKEKRFMIESLQKESIEYVNSKERWLAVTADYTEIYALMFYDRLLQTNADIIIFYSDFIKKNNWKNAELLFCAVDLDLVDHSVFETPPADQIKIQKFIRGRCEITDLMASERSGNGNVAIYDGTWRKFEPKSRALLKTVCPGHYSKRSCGSDIRLWLCVMCKLPLYYTFERGIFCDQCGVGSADDFSFRCDNIEHIYPIPLTKKQYRELNTLTPMKEIKILLLGPFNVDKLTWINGLCKHMLLKLLKSLEVKEIKELTPSKFVIANTQMQLKTVYVCDGVNKDSNEPSKGDCRKYHVILDDVLFTLIDTPVLGRQGEEIGATIKHILDYMRHIDVLHGICLFFSERHSWHKQLDLCWRWLKEIFCKLHQNAVRNLTFCFNNSSQSNSDETRLANLKSLFYQIEVDFDLGSRMFKFWNHWFDEWCYFKEDDFSEDVMHYEHKLESSLEATRLLQTISTLDPLILNHALPNPSAV